MSRSGKRPLEAKPRSVWVVPSAQPLCYGMGPMAGTTSPCNTSISAMANRNSRCREPVVQSTRGRPTKICLTPGSMETPRHGIRSPRKPRHTTHHHHLPERVTIIRSHHPFEARSLEVLSKIHRNGRLYLVLILPDGSKSVIPVEWTDYASVTQPRQAASAQNRAVLGSIEDLLHARAITDALLNRLVAPTGEAAARGLCVG